MVQPGLSDPGAGRVIYPTTHHYDSSTTNPTNERNFPLGSLGVESQRYQGDIYQDEEVVQPRQPDPGAGRIIYSMACNSSLANLNYENNFPLGVLGVESQRYQSHLYQGEEEVSPGLEGIAVDPRLLHTIPSSQPGEAKFTGVYLS